MSDELWLAIIQVCGSVLSIAVTVLLPLLIATLRQKKKLEITAAQEAQLEHAAREAVLIVKELAAAKLKEQKAAGQTPVPMTPAEKKTTAISTMVEALPNTTREDAERKVIAAMPTVGEGAAANPPQAPAGQ